MIFGRRVPQPARLKQNHKFLTATFYSLRSLTLSQRKQKKKCKSTRVYDNKELNKRQLNKFSLKEISSLNFFPEVI